MMPETVAFLHPETMMLPGALGACGLTWFCGGGGGRGPHHDRGTSGTLGLVRPLLPLLPLPPFPAPLAPCARGPHAWKREIKTIITTWSS